MKQIEEQSLSVDQQGNSRFHGTCLRVQLLLDHIYVLSQLKNSLLKSLHDDSFAL